MKDRKILIIINEHVNRAIGTRWPILAPQQTIAPQQNSYEGIAHRQARDNQDDHAYK